LPWDVPRMPLALVRLCQDIRIYAWRNRHVLAYNHASLIILVRSRTHFAFMTVAVVDKLSAIQSATSRLMRVRICTYKETIKWSVRNGVHEKRLPKRTLLEWLLDGVCIACSINKLTFIMRVRVECESCLVCQMSKWTMDDGECADPYCEATDGERTRGRRWDKQEHDVQKGWGWAETVYTMNDGMILRSSISDETTVHFRYGDTMLFSSAQ
jgi:hypothetical protein